MKFFLLILSIFFFGITSSGQKGYKVYYYSDSTKINNTLFQSETTFTVIKPNGKTRFVFWEDNKNKLSILFKLKDSKKKIKIKNRVELFKNGRWHKPKIEIKFLRDRSIWGVWITRWSTNYTILHNNGVRATGWPIKIVFENSNGEAIEVYGHIKLICYNPAP